MKSKLLDVTGGKKTFVLIFDDCDEVIELMTAFADDEKIDAAHFTAVGAFADATLGFFQMDSKEYKKIPIKEQVEVLVMAGNVAVKEEHNEPKVHAHVVVGKADGTTMGGHVMAAHVRPTLEVTLVETPAHLRRQIDDKTGLALIALDASAASAVRIER